MIRPRDEWKVLSAIDGINDHAYDILFDKYIIQNVTGEQKITEIGGTDQETLIIKKSGGWPIPGFIYTFIYKGREFILEERGKEKKYNDLVPIFFCMDIKMDSFTGLNLNMIPPAEKLRFLDSFWDVFSDFLEREVDALAEYGKEAINKRFVSLMASGGAGKLLRVFNSMNRARFEFAYRKYLPEKVERLRMIEYSEWKYIPFFEPKDAFRKINFKEIYRNYYNSL